MVRGLRRRRTGREEAPGAKTGEEANVPADSTPGTDAEATDEARELAAERGLDLSEIEGSGKDGRVTKKDVEAHSA